MRVVSAEEAVSTIASGQRVFIQGAAATPQRLVAAMTARARELRDVEIVHLHTEGPAPYAAPGLRGSFRVNSLFLGANVREAVARGDADYVPVFLSEVPALFTRGSLPLDLARAPAPPPGRHGFCALGTSVDAARAAVRSAHTVIAQVNPRMPRTHGDGLIHEREIHAAVEVDDPLPEHPRPVLGEVERAIGRHCAGLIED